MNPTVASVFSAILYVLVIAIVGRALISWFPIDRRNPFVQALNTITEPILEPLRRVVPRIGMFDLSAMVAIVLLLLMIRVLDRLSTG